MKKEKMVSNVLSTMSRNELTAINLICNYASGLVRTKTTEAFNAALLIRDDLKGEKQKVAYYLIGKAEADQCTPIILSIFL